MNLKRLWTSIFKSDPRSKHPVSAVRTAAKPQHPRSKNSKFEARPAHPASEINRLLGYRAGKPEIYRIAFRHSSSTDSANGILNNQRLEYLGDAILGAAVADYLYQRLPGRNEGYLTQMRSKIVSRKSLNEIAGKMRLNQYIESRMRNPEKGESMLGDTLEALIGAIYIDKGFETARGFVVERIIERFINFEELDQQVISYKGKLIEWAQKQKRTLQIRVDPEEGSRPDRPKFRCEIRLDGELIASAAAGSKKKAEEKAADVAFVKLGIK